MNRQFQLVWNRDVLNEIRCVRKSMIFQACSARSLVKRRPFKCIASYIGMGPLILFSIDAQFASHHRNVLCDFVISGSYWFYVLIQFVWCIHK